MSDKPVSEMSEAELAEYYFAHRHDPDMAGDQVAYTPPRGQRVAIRLSLDEERRVREAAQAVGMTVSAFLRRAALDAADNGRVVDIERLRRDVGVARSRIDDAWQALA
ncbi:MAG: plasmid mobilization protein [Micromonosporaceae bacterium]